MKTDIPSPELENDDRCLLAVVGGRHEQVGDVVKCFALQGDRVRPFWYESARQLSVSEPKPRFGAVILFSSEEQDRADAEEALLRAILPMTPVYRL